VDCSLAAFCIAVAARHDGIVRAVFALGRMVRSYRLHQLAYHLGQLHRAMAMAGVAWLAVAAALTVPSSPITGIACVGVLAILVVMARTARDRVRQSRHERRSTGQRGPSVRDAGHAVVQPDLRLIGSRVPPLPGVRIVLPELGSVLRPALDATYLDL
jgi:hypothetical protein